jgi:hypothetical protein
MWLGKVVGERGWLCLSPSFSKAVRRTDAGLFYFISCAYLARIFATLGAATARQ